MGAGLCGALLDWGKYKNENDQFLSKVYFVRSVTGFISASLTMAAAFSYSAPLCKHLANGYAQHQLRYRALFVAGELAGKLALRVRLLVWVARFNWVGLALTAVEIGYLLMKDNDLQNWCEKSVFRKEKKTVNWGGRSVVNDKFASALKELEALEIASQVVGAGA